MTGRSRVRGSTTRTASGTARGRSCSATAADRPKARYKAGQLDGGWIWRNWIWHRKDGGLLQQGYS